MNMAGEPCVKLTWKSAGQEATSRCEAIDQLDADNASKQEFEQELSRLIPQPGSSSESTQLRQLREIQEKAQEQENASASTSRISIDSNTKQSDRRRQHVTMEKGSDGVVVETELYWSAKRLIWSRGGVILRAFSYEEEVKCACWAWMDSEPTWEKSSTSGNGSSIQNRSREKREGKSVVEAGSSNSSLQQSFQKSRLTKDKTSAKRVFRALCVFMPSCLVIYHPESGQEYIKRLDLQVLNVYPLSTGLLIQRSTEAEDRKRSLQAHQGVFGADPPLSTLFYLRRPYDELKAVEIVEGIRFTRTKSKKLISARLKQGTKGQTFNEIDEQVIMVSESPPILVSASLEGRCLRVYAYAHNRLPFNRFEDNREDRSTFTGQPAAKRAKENETSPFGAPLARRSTMESRFGARPKLPSRKSARLESGSGRVSIGGPRSSIGGDRTRTSSATGHARRTSGGLNSMYVQGGHLVGEEENKSIDEDNMQEMMQLLDEFDEVGEESQLQQQNWQTPSNRISAPGTVNRRRTSRAVNPTSVPPKTPYIKTRAIEERRISRSRMSMPGGNAIEGNPVSVAMELSQKDEASRIAMTTTSGDKAMTRGGMSSEGSDGRDQAVLEGLSIFQDLGQGFSAVTLLEEIPVAELQSLRDLPSIKAFIQKEKDMALLTIVMPFCTRLLTRQIVEQPLMDDTDSFTLRSYAPTSPTIDSQVLASDAFIFHGGRTKDLLLAEIGESNYLHLVAGPPGTLAKTVKLNISFAQHGLRIQDLPLRIESNHGLLQINLQTDPQCKLTATVMSLCEIILSPEHFREMRMAWIQHQTRSQAQEWTVLVDLLLWGNTETFNKTPSTYNNQSKFVNLLGSLGEDRIDNQEIKSVSRPVSQWSQVELAKLVEGLNMVAQNARIDVCERNRDLPRMAVLISTLARRLGWFSWLDYWLRLVPDATINAIGKEETSSIQEAAIFDIVKHTHAAIKSSSKLINLDILSLLPRMRSLLDVYYSFTMEADTFDTMSGDLPSPAGRRAKGVVEAMLRNKIGLAELTRMPIALALPLRQAIKQCEKETPTRWSAQAYLFIGRGDLAKQMMPSTVTIPSSEVDVRNTLSSSSAGHISSRLFPNDYRLKEVGEMLQTSRPIATKGPDAATMEDQEVIAEQQKRVFVSASDRIKSLSVGRGMFKLSSVSFKSTEQWKTSPLCLRIRILNNCIIQHREPDADSNEMEWPEFHNGVASALQLAISQDKIESSWLYSQLNKEFKPRHAGLIFGIGLLGQLRTLGKIHAHYYLSSRHSATTIGLLLGISLSFLGSCDPLAKALMSIHLIHTLPTHSRPLKTSMLEQSAALVGLGFVFMASKDRWASRMAFKAIATESVMTDDSQMLKRECFSLSAAISLGLTCLGQGKTTMLAGEIEKEIIPGLEKLIIVFTLDNASEKQRQEKIIDEKNYTEFEWKPDISLATSPASIALALIYLKSNRLDKAEKMPLPYTTAQLEKIRPDVLLIRAICRSLIMWDNIQPDLTWLDSNLPIFLQYESVRKVSQASESCQMAYWSLRVGSIFSIGLKYAGTNDVQARRCLIDELHYFQSQVEIRPASYFDKIRQQMFQNSIDIILNSLSMVLAGSGDVEVLQHLRRGLYRVETLRYGNYMATSMAIGMLFLGAGRYTLATSDSAIAALLIAFYPRFPVNAQDNRCHLQAYRHFWLLAVEARLLSVEDVDSGESSRMPVNMQLQQAENNKATQGVISMPCLLPKLQELKSIQIASDRYFALKLDLKGNPLHQKAVVESRKLYVKKKAADLSHDEDKWGKSSLRARTGNKADCTQLPTVHDDNQRRIRERGQECKQLRDMIKENVHDKDVHALVDVVFGSRVDQPYSEQEEALELFVLQSVMDCLLQDKVEILPLMISLYSSTQLLLNRYQVVGSEDSQSNIYLLLDLHQIFLVTHEQGDNLSIPPLLESTYIRALWILLQDNIVSKLTQTNDESLKKSLQEYASTGSIQDNGRHQLASLLIVAEVPPLSLLLEVKTLVEQRIKQSMKTTSKMQSLIQAVFSELGYETRVEVINVLIETWMNVL